MNAFLATSPNMDWLHKLHIHRNVFQVTFSHPFLWYSLQLLYYLLLLLKNILFSLAFVFLEQQISTLLLVKISNWISVFMIGNLFAWLFQVGAFAKIVEGLMERNTTTVFHCILFETGQVNLLRDCALTLLLGFVHIENVVLLIQ